MLLLEAKAVNPKNGNEGTPLSWAVKNGHENVVKLLQTAMSSYAPRPFLIG